MTDERVIQYGRIPGRTGKHAQGVMQPHIGPFIPVPSGLSLNGFSSPSVFLERCRPTGTAANAEYEKALPVFYLSRTITDS